MGYHLVNVGLRGGAADPASGDVVIALGHPEMLLYEKRPDGTLHLRAARVDVEAEPARDAPSLEPARFLLRCHGAGADATRDTDNTGAA